MDGLAGVRDRRRRRLVELDQWLRQHLQVAPSSSELFFLAVWIDGNDLILLSLRTATIWSNSRVWASRYRKHKSHDDCDDPGSASTT